MGSYDRYGCCHIINAAAVVGALQLIVIALLISNSGAIYQNWGNWMSQTSGGGVTGSSLTGTAFLQIHLANTISLHVVWAVCLAIYLLSFRYYRPLMVIPNLVLQVVALLWGIVFIGSIGQSITELPNKSVTQMNEQEKERCTFLVTAIVIACGLWIIEAVFLVVVLAYYRYLQQQGGGGYPEASAVVVASDKEGIMTQA